MFRFTRFSVHCAVVVLGGCTLQPQLSRAQSAPSQSDPRTACASDIQKICAAVSPGGGRVLACLKQHKDEVSDGCKNAILTAMGQSAGAAGSTNPGSAPAPSTASSPAPSSGSSPRPSVSAPAPAAKPAPTAKSAPAAKPAKAAPEHVILGEHFVQRAVVDTRQDGMTAATVYVPENWRFEGKVEWNYGWVEVPVATSWHAENPANAEAYFQYPLLRMASVDAAPRWRQYVKNPKPGDHYSTGPIYMEPVPPLQALAAFIKKTRGDVTNLKWLGNRSCLTWARPCASTSPTGPPIAASL